MIGCDILLKKEKGPSSSQSFMKGAAVLTVSLFLVKLIGVFFKIFVTGMLGPTGAAYFNFAYEVYNPLFALATAGLPIAISRMVSENVAKHRYKDVKMIHRVSVPIFFTTGIIGMIFMIILAFIVPRLKAVNISGAMYAVFALSPTILFACLMSIYRGYYQGLKNVKPTAVSEIIEASCKLFFGFFLSAGIMKVLTGEFNSNGTVLGRYYATKEQAQAAIMPFASAGAILGVSIGALAGFIYLLIIYKKYGDGITKEQIEASRDNTIFKFTAKTLIKTALPIGVGAIIMNLAGSIDMFLILNRIQSIAIKDPLKLISIYWGDLPSAVLDGVEGIHTFLKGCYDFTAPFLMLVTAITTAFGIVALPSVTEAWTEKRSDKLKKSMDTVIKMTALVTIPAGVGIAILGPNILSLLYPNRAGAVHIASNIIPIVGIGAIFMAGSMPVCSMLQAIGRVDLPVKIISLGLLIKIVVNYIFVGIPQVNIQGAGIGTLVGYLFIVIVALYYLCKETKVKIGLVSTILKPTFATLICGATAYFSISFFSSTMSNLPSLILSVGLSVLVYFVSVILIGTFTRDEIKLWPKGEKIIKVLEKLHIVI